MRISNNMMMNQSLRDMNTNLSKLDRTQRDISTGKRIHRPSDDPTSMARAQVLRNSIAQNAQFAKNADSAKSHLEMTDSTLSQVGDALQRLNELAVQAASGSLRDEDRNAIKVEVPQIRDELRALGNTTLNGRSIFGGLKTDQVVYPPDAFPPLGSGVTLSPNDNGSLITEVAPNITLSYNVTAPRVFGDTTPPVPPATTGAPNMFQTIDDFVGYLDGTLAPPVGSGIGTSNRAISEISLRDIGKWLDNVNQTRTEVGGKLNRLELAKSRMQEANISMNELLVETEDTDIAEASLKLNSYEATYRAALAVSARAIPMSLVDFLR
jgi:flagellar hook-associated protein 3 FlgL